MEQYDEIKILSWTYKGFKTPNVTIKIEDQPNKNTNFTLLQMLSGVGKTTTLNLLRYSFYDLNDHVSKSEIEKLIEELRSSDSNIDQGEFEVIFKLNKTINYRIKIIFDYITKEINYETNSGEEGYSPGLKLPPELKRFITPEFIEKTFFDLRMANRLYDKEAGETDKTIKKLCKIDYLDEIENSLKKYRVEFIKKNRGKLKDKDLSTKEKLFERLTKQRDKVEEKAKKYKDKKYTLSIKLKKIIEDKSKIENTLKDIKNKIHNAQKTLDEKNENLRLAFEETYDYLKNPMSINKEIEEQLINFEENLYKHRIPKAVGETFFKDLINDVKCICGHKMTDEMKKIINDNKAFYLAEDIVNVLSPIKTSVQTFEKRDQVMAKKSFEDLIKKEREANIAQKEFYKITSTTDDETYNQLTKDEVTTQNELKEITDWLEDEYEKPYSPDDPPDSESIKYLNKRLLILEKEIEERAGAVELGEKIRKLTTWLKEIQEISLEKISQKIIQDVNKEVKRVLPLEKIYIDSIKNRITLKTEKGIRKTGSSGGASRGQMARIAYLFLITLLNRPHLKFPFIVDSPVTDLDSIARTEIARSLAKILDSQYIGLVLDEEKSNFSPPLYKELDGNISFITAFGKNEAFPKMIELSKKYNVDINKFDDGIVAYGKDFFDEFEGAKLVTK